MRSRESEEMYLETILVLKKAKGAVRSLDIADHLGYSKPSVSRAVGLLKSKGYIAVDSSGMIHLSAEGEKKSEAIFERHSVLTAFLVGIGASVDMAEENACRIEHFISDELFEIIKEKVNSTKK